MKKTVFAVALFLAATSAHAAKIETCLNNVTNRCGERAILRAWNATTSNQCAIVNAGTREDGTRYEQKVIFKDYDTVYSIELGRCSVSRVDIRGQFREQKQYKGRLFSLTQDGRVIVVGRDNVIVNLINSRNQPYTSIKDIKIEGEQFHLKFDNNQDLDLDAQDVLQKLNHPSARLR